MEKTENRQGFNQTIRDDLQPIKVKCPECLKLYAVNPDEIKTSRPKFECLKCTTQFWFPYPETLGGQVTLGFPLDWLKEDNALSRKNLKPRDPPPSAQKAIHFIECAKCGYHQSPEWTECQSCGVMIQKAELRKLWSDRGLKGDEELEGLWKNILSDYENEKKQDEFVSVCAKKENLAFAAYQYKNMLKAHSGDEMALSMQKKIEALNSQLVNCLEVSPRRRGLNFSVVLSLMGGLLIGVGAVLPQSRNLIGIGVAIIFLTLALRFWR